jgi:D-aspartate ligase
VANIDTVQRVPVLLFGAHIAALGVLRMLARRQVPTYVVDDTSDVISRSRWYRPPGRKLIETSDSGELARYLQSLPIQQAVVIACSDRWMTALTGLPAELRRRFLASVPPQDSVAQLLDKERFGALVERLGIPHPRSIRLDEPDALGQATDEELANGFLKPTDSNLHKRHFGPKGYFAQSRAAAAERVERARVVGITYVLQEWVPGDFSKTVLLDGFVDRHGRLVALVARRRIRMFPARLGNTVSAVTIPLREVRGATASLRTLLRALAYRGVFNAEFKFDERDGEFKIIEVNPRPAWYIAPLANAGVDLPWMAYLDAQELPVTAPGSYQLGRHGLYEFLDAFSLAGAIASGRRPEGPVLRPWLTGDRTLFWWSDPLPAVGGAVQAVRRRVDAPIESKGQLRRPT